MVIDAAATRDEAEQNRQRRRVDGNWDPEVRSILQVLNDKALCGHKEARAPGGTYRSGRLASQEWLRVPPLPRAGWPPDLPITPKVSSNPARKPCVDMRKDFGWLTLVFALAGCNAVLGLNDLKIDQSIDPNLSDGGVVGECTTNQQCIDRFTADAGGTALDDGVVAAVCVRPERKCVPLRSEDCQTITGDFKNDDAIVIGSLFSTVGAQAATNIPRQQSAMLAVEQVNAAGGIPSRDSSSSGRPLVLVSCDESTKLQRAGGHLVNDLHVPAIVGPNTSQDTLDLSGDLTIGKGTVVMTPTAVASSITSLIDDDLTWLMVPSDVQRAKLMIDQIGELETRLKAERGVDVIKLGVAFRDDALGVGTRTSLNDLIINGKSIADSVNLGSNVRIDAYSPTAADQATIVAAQVKFAPDIVVLAGTAEAISKVLVPLEKDWDSSKPRPEYVLIDSTKVPELLDAAVDEGLRKRVRGTGITSAGASAGVFNAFKIDYSLKYAGSSTTISGMGPSYDAAYGIAFALAATSDEPVSGKAVAKGLRKLAGGSTTIDNQSTQIRAAFQQLAGGDEVTAVGTFGPLDWDDDGAVRGGALVMWCIGMAGGKPGYQDSGLTFDIATQKYSGAYAACTP
jgi:branched-chain amino acid transport system substrate-binding protein